jgi:hypothetical protein
MIKAADTSRSTAGQRFTAAEAAGVALPPWAVVAVAAAPPEVTEGKLAIAAIAVTGVTAGTGATAEIHAADEIVVTPAIWGAAARVATAEIGVIEAKWRAPPAPVPSPPQPTNQNKPL